MVAHYYERYTSVTSGSTMSNSVFSTTASAPCANSTAWVTVYTANNYDYVGLYECPATDPSVWRPPNNSPIKDIKKDRPNRPLVHNSMRHISPIHFRHVRTQQRKI